MALRGNSRIDSGTHENLLVLYLVALSLALSGCVTAGAARPEPEADPPHAVDGHEPLSAYGVRERFEFDTARELADKADVIVVGTVRTVEPGRSVGDSSGEVDFLNVTVSVERLHKGVVGADHVTFEFLPFPRIDDLRGFPPFEPDSPWWGPGSTSLFFLRSTRSGGLQVINSQGVYYMPDGPDGVLELTTSADDVGAEIGGKTLSELATELFAAR